MLELLKAYSVEQILIFSVILAFAVKSTVDFTEWIQEKYNKKFNKDHSALEKEEDTEEKYNELKDQFDTLMSEFHGLDQRMEKRMENIESGMENIESQLIQLTQSDMHDIKSWMVEKHHQLTEAGWVDDFTMDTIEKRFDDYKKENGNSYVEGLVNEMRALPRHPQKDM